MDANHNPAKVLRELMGYTQGQCADLIQVSLRTWSRWETTGTMPRAKAQAFHDAVRRIDEGEQAAPTQSKLGEALRELGASSARDLYPADDPFGQKRLEPLRFVPPKEEAQEPEVFETIDVSPEEVGEMARSIRSQTP